MNRTPSPRSDEAKFSKMHDLLDRDIETIITAIDGGGTARQRDTDSSFTFSPGLFAGLCTAKVLLAHAQYTEMGEPVEGGWRAFRSRLQFTVHAQTDAPDAGEPTAWGFWDGLHHAAVEAGKLDNETVLMDGRSNPAGVVPGA